MRTVLTNATVIDCVGPRPVPGASITSNGPSTSLTLSGVNGSEGFVRVRVQ